MSIIQKCIYFFKISFENQINQFDRFDNESLRAFKISLLIIFQNKLVWFYLLYTFNMASNLLKCKRNYWY